MTTTISTTLGVTFAAILAGAANGVVSVVLAVVRFPGNLKAHLRSWQSRREVMPLLDMDDYMLRDIGLSRGDVTSALASPSPYDATTRLRVIAVERRAGIMAQARERLAMAEAEANPPRSWVIPEQ